MKLLLDTQIVIWAATDDPRLSARARSLIATEAEAVAFSVINIWEIAIKSALGRADFTHAPRRLREQALRAGWAELPVMGAHALALSGLPDIHGDPFDRMLVAQARAEGMVLLSVDRTLLRYGDPVRPG